MKRLIRSRLWLVLALAMPVVMSCTDETIVGAYSATTFTYAPAGGTPKDVLAAGGNINLTIFHDLSTSGSLLVPASVTGTTTFSASLLGDAAQNGNTVTFSLIADSFMRDMTFTFDGTSLSGSGTFSGTTIVVTLSK